MKKQWLLYLLIFECGLLFGQDSLQKVYSLKFTGYKTTLTRETKATLNEVANVMKSRPEQNLKVTGYCGGTENRQQGKANWDRINNVITHFVEKLGIDAKRFIFRYGEEGADCNTVELAFTDESPPTNTPPPVPNLRKN